MSTRQEHLKALISLKNFSKCGGGDFLEVDLVNQTDLELKVKIYPCTGEFVSIYVARETAEKPFSAEEVQCFVSVIDCNGVLRFTQSYTFHNQTKEDVFIFGWKQCFNRIGILDDSEDLIPDDVLNLQFDFTYKGKKVSKSILNAGKALRNLAETFRLNQELQKSPVQRLLDLPAVVPDLLKSIGYYFTSLLGINEEWIIIETMHGIQHHIRFKEGIETLGSKLCDASPVLCRLLKSPMREKEDKKIQIIDFDASTFSAFLHFIEYGEITWTDEVEDFYSLYELSDKYAVLNLMKECSQYLALKINTENVVDIARLATMHSDDQLKRAVAVFLTIRETWFVGKTSPLILSKLAEKVHLKSVVPGNFTAIENTDCRNLQKKQVVILRTYEDACILYGIADEFKMDDMMMVCAQYMKQSITAENARIFLSYVKQYHNSQPLSFVKSYIEENKSQYVNEAIGTSSPIGLRSASASDEDSNSSDTKLLE